MVQKFNIQKVSDYSRQLYYEMCIKISTFFRLHNIQIYPEVCENMPTTTRVCHHSCQKCHGSRKTAEINHNSNTNNIITNGLIRNNNSKTYPDNHRSLNPPETMNSNRSSVRSNLKESQHFCHTNNTNKSNCSKRIRNHGSSKRHHSSFN